MGRVVNWIYGLLLLWFAVESLWLDFIPNEFLPYVILLMGLLVFFTPIDPPEDIRNPLFGTLHPRALFNFIRRRLFGATLALMGLASLVEVIGDFAPLLMVETYIGSIILAAIAVIYFLSSFTGARNYQIRRPSIN